MPCCTKKQCTPLLPAPPPAAEACHIGYDCFHITLLQLHDVPQTEDGFQPVFFEPRPLRNLLLIDEMASLMPLTDMKVRACVEHVTSKVLKPTKQEAVASPVLYGSVFHAAWRVPLHDGSSPMPLTDMQGCECAKHLHQWIGQ